MYVLINHDPILILGFGSKILTKFTIIQQFPFYASNQFYFLLNMESNQSILLFMLLFT